MHWKPRQSFTRTIGILSLWDCVPICINKSSTANVDHDSFPGHQDHDNQPSHDPEIQ